MFSLQNIWFGVLVGCAIGGIAADENKIVETENGRVRGVLKKSLLKNNDFYSFQGIPYAKPPIGDLRFKVPKPVESWAPKVFDAFEERKACISAKIGGSGIMPVNPQSEDCLTLNIYVPADVKPNEKLAVLFFIHGGGFIEDSSRGYGPDFIIEKRTILVTFNYRLGVFGFLSFDTPEYSGNMGLKDQQLALKWISANIERFGGDSKRITIFGQSAGSGSAHYHVLSEESRKYFRNAIMMSGSAYNHGVLSNDDHLKRAFWMAKTLGKPQKTRDQLIAFLKSVPAHKISQFAEIKTINSFVIYIPIGPIIERKDAIQPFLLEKPSKVYETSDFEVDAMFTLTSQEALSYSPIRKTKLEKLNDDFDVPLPVIDLEAPPVDSKEHRKLMKKIREFYFGDAPINEETLSTLYDFISDVAFNFGSVKSVKQHVTHAKGKAYFIWFDINTALNINKRISELRGVPKLPGAVHGDDLFYLFRYNLNEDIYNEILNNDNEEEVKIVLRTIDYMSTLYTNFAKYSEPTHNNLPIAGLQPVEENNVHFLNISNDGLKIDSQPRKEAINFWENIEKHIEASSDMKARQCNEP